MTVPPIKQGETCALLPSVVRGLQLAAYFFNNNARASSRGVCLIFYRQKGSAMPYDNEVEQCSRQQYVRIYKFAPAYLYVDQWFHVFVSSTSTAAVDLFIFASHTVYVCRGERRAQSIVSDSSFVFLCFIALLTLQRCIFFQCNLFKAYMLACDHGNWPRQVLE